MSNFNELFDEWSSKYDETVFNKNGEYKEVFENYKEILNTIFYEVNMCRSILEIGCGTGNLTKILYDNHLDVMGIEPSKEMRKITINKLPSVEILEGHFLDIPVKKQFDAIVSSYAFHHLTFQEKQEAFRYLDGFLNENGKLVIVDTMFESIEYKHRLLDEVKRNNAYQLLKDLNSEYYEYLNDMLGLVKDLEYDVKYQKLNKYVWILIYTKKSKEYERKFINEI